MLSWCGAGKFMGFFLQDSQKQANIYFSKPPFISSQGHSDGWNKVIHPQQVCKDTREPGEKAEHKVQNVIIWDNDWDLSSSPVIISFHFSSQAMKHECVVSSHGPRTCILQNTCPSFL